MDGLNKEKCFEILKHLRQVAEHHNVHIHIEEIQGDGVDIVGALVNGEREQNGRTYTFNEAFVGNHFYNKREYHDESD